MKAVFPGSFDPITRGHIDVIERISKLYDEVIVLVANSSTKSPMFSAGERVELVSGVVKKFKNVTVANFNGLTVDFAKSQNAAVIVRSLRDSGDFEYENAIAEANRKLRPEIETVFVAARPEFLGIASSLVKEIARNGGSLSKFLTPKVSDAVKKKVSVNPSRAKDSSEKISRGERTASKKEK